MKTSKRIIDEESDLYKEALAAFCTGTHATELISRFPVKLDTLRRYFRRSLGDEAYRDITKQGSTIKKYKPFDLTAIIPRPTKEKPEPPREYLTIYNEWMSTASVTTPVWAYTALPEIY